MHHQCYIKVHHQVHCNMKVITCNKKCTIWVKMKFVLLNLGSVNLPCAALPTYVHVCTGAKFEQHCARLFICQAVVDKIKNAVIKQILASNYEWIFRQELDSNVRSLLVWRWWISLRAYQTITDQQKPCQDNTISKQLSLSNPHALNTTSAHLTSSATQMP